MINQQTTSLASEKGLLHRVRQLEIGLAQYGNWKLDFSQNMDFMDMAVEMDTLFMRSMVNPFHTE